MKAKEIKSLSVEKLEEKLQELKNLSVAELNKKLEELKKDLFMLRMQHATNQLDNPMQIAAAKKDIARVKTIIREKETNV